MGLPEVEPYGEKSTVDKVLGNILPKKKKGYKKYSTLEEPWEWEDTKY